MKIKEILLFGFILVLISAGCSGAVQATPSTQTVEATLQSPTEATQSESSEGEETTKSAEIETPPPAAITAVPFDLGDSIIEQDWVENKDFRNLPIRLEGLIAAPPTGDHLPIAILIHGSHGSGCKSDEQGETVYWPCPEDELRHYEGFAYLVEALAEDGYVAVSINANPAFVSAFGDPAANPRLVNLFDQYLAKLAAAVNGEAVDLGVDLAGRVDWNQLVILGHSQGGEGVYWIVDGRVDHTSPEQVNAGQGPVAAAILVAPANITPREHDLAVPFAVFLPECDRDLASLGGQFYYEEARQAAQRDALAESVYLHLVNHNRFNSVLEDDTPSKASAICKSLLPSADIQAFLASYATQFFDVALGRVAVTPAALGLDATKPAADTILGMPALTSLALPSAQRLRLPVDEGEAVGTAAAVYCEQGFIADAEKKGPCGRDQLKQPGIPEEVAVTWDGQGGAFGVAVPTDSGDLSAYEVLHFRTAVNPVSELNAPGQAQSFSVQLQDSAGKTAGVTLKDEPALAFPSGEMSFDDFLNLNTWDNHVILSSVRIPLAEFSGVDLTNVQTISLVFDATDRGAIFFTDLELLDAK